MVDRAIEVLRHHRQKHEIKRGGTDQSPENRDRRGAADLLARFGSFHRERRACQVIGCQRMTIRYRSRRPDDPRLRERLVALARERRRFGYRRLLIFLRREGFVANYKQLFRIYREERLMVP